MAVSLIFAAGSTTVSAQDNSYPRFINDSIVGVTIDHVDEFNFIKIDRDERIQTLKLYQTALLEYDAQLVKLQAYSKALEASNNYQSNQIAENLKAITNYSAVVAGKDREIENGLREIKSQKLRTTIAWIAGGVATGIMAGLYVAKR